MNEDLAESNFKDKMLVCKDCGNKFIWTAGEQKFFYDKGLENAPKRCKICTAQYKIKLREKHPMWWIKCQVCGKKTEVSFEPKTEDIYCEDCFKKQISKRNQAITDIGQTIPE